MEFIRLTEEEQKEVLDNLNQNEREVLETAEQILQKIAGIYINKPGYHPEMADIYRLVAGTMSDLRKL